MEFAVNSIISNTLQQDSLSVLKGLNEMKY